MLPRQKIRTATWAESRIERIPSGEKTARVDFQQYPHVVSVLDAFDDPSITDIVLQWGAQLGKTFAMQLMIASALANDPSPMAFADATERSLVRVFKRLWKLLDNIPDLAAVLPQPSARHQSQIETSVALLHGAWSGSPEAAADFGARYVFLNEVDKMIPSKTAMEADFRDSMRDRAFGVKRAKFVYASTPSVTGESYIEEKMLLGDNRRWQVPCPHCEMFQSLKSGDGKNPGGLRGLKYQGKLHVKYALDNAYYECEFCQEKIVDGDRKAMQLAGIWVPEGCMVAGGKLTGEPLRPGPLASFGELHSLNCLLPAVTFGTMAKELCSALLSPQRARAMRKWRTTSEGKTWDPAPPVMETTALEMRLGEERPPRITPAWLCDQLADEGPNQHHWPVPAWARFLTAGIDVSWLGDNDFQFHWLVSAWGQGGRGGLVAFGTTPTRKLFREWLKRADFECPERAGKFTLSKSVIDSGNKGNSVYEFCDSLPGLLLPIKGGSHKEDQDFDDREKSDQMSKGGFRGTPHAWQKALKIKMRQYDLITVNSHLSQQWCADRLSGLISRSDPSFYSFPREIFGLDFLTRVDLPKQLIGDYLRDGKWVKRYDAQHYRDGWRYGMVAADSYVRDGTQWDNPPDTLIPLVAPASSPAPERRGAAGFPSYWT